MCCELLSLMEAHQYFPLLCFKIITEYKQYLKICIVLFCLMVWLQEATRSVVSHWITDYLQSKFIHHLVSSPLSEKVSLLLVIIFFYIIKCNLSLE